VVLLEAARLHEGVQGIGFVGELILINFVRLFVSHVCQIHASHCSIRCLVGFEGGFLFVAQDVLHTALNLAVP